MNNANVLTKVRTNSGRFMTIVCHAGRVPFPWSMPRFSPVFDSALCSLASTFNLIHHSTLEWLGHDARFPFHGQTLLTDKVEKAKKIIFVVEGQKSIEKTPHENMNRIKLPFQRSFPDDESSSRQMTRCRCVEADNKMQSSSTPTASRR